jgi:hypothetical protein
MDALKKEEDKVVNTEAELTEGEVFKTEEPIPEVVGETTLEETPEEVAVPPPAVVLPTKRKRCPPKCMATRRCKQKKTRKNKPINGIMGGKRSKKNRKSKKSKKSKK